MSKRRPTCPDCGTSHSLVLECTGYWDREKGEWCVSDGNNEEVWCNGGEDGSCDWLGYFNDLKWEDDNGEENTTE